MPERYEVFAAIEGERDYQEQRWRHTCVVEDVPYESDAKKNTDQWLSYIAGYNMELLHAISHIPGNEAALVAFRKLAALCVACMEANGCCPRDTTTGYPDEFREAPISRKRIFRFIDTERTLQDGRGYPSLTVSGEVVLFQHYIHQAVERRITNPHSDEYALNTIRKLAGIAVRAMEEHGVILREPFEE